jgi:hypothetical protein
MARINIIHLFTTLKPDFFFIIFFFNFFLNTFILYKKLSLYKNFKNDSKYAYNFLHQYWHASLHCGFSSICPNCNSCEITLYLLNSLYKNSNFLRYYTQLLEHLSLFDVSITTVKDLSTFTLFHHLFSFRSSFEVLAEYHFSVLIIFVFQSPGVTWPTPYYSDTICIISSLPSLY